LTSRIDFSFRTRSKELDRPLLRKTIKKVSKIVGLIGELSVSLVDDYEMRALNRTYRDIDRPTDVLGFAFQEGREFPKTDLQPDLVGDIVISVETAARQAERRKMSLQKEVEDLFIHGILHLLGYDHTISREKALEMRKREREVRRTLDGAERS
jgi:probable rRNA maturation factor